MIILSVGRMGWKRLRFRPARARPLSRCPSELSTKETDDSRYRRNIFEEQITTQKTLDVRRVRRVSRTARGEHLLARCLDASVAASCSAQCSSCHVDSGIHGG